MENSKGSVIGQRHAATPQIIYTKLHAATPQIIYTKLWGLCPMTAP